MAERKRITFQTWGEYLTQCELPPADGAAQSSIRENSSWAGGGTYESTMNLARFGWHEGERDILAIARTLESAVLPGIVREDWNYEVEGVTFDVARYLEGEPEHWVKIEESEQDNPQKHVKIVYNTAASCGVSAETITARGAAVAALVECLEFSGKRVELWSAQGIDENYRQPDRGGFEVLVKVKAYDQPLDLARVAFALSHPGMLRRLGFRMIEQERPDLTHMSYGYPGEVATSEDDNLYIGEMMYGEGDWNSPAYVKHWLLATLAAQGVTLNLTEVGNAA